MPETADGGGGAAGTFAAQGDERCTASQSFGDCHGMLSLEYLDVGIREVRPYMSVC
jgi:hypothetical protein